MRNAFAVNPKEGLGQASKKLGERLGFNTFVTEGLKERLYNFPTINFRFPKYLE
jgi:hypothetical protein